MLVVLLQAESFPLVPTQLTAGLGVVMFPFVRLCSQPVALVFALRITVTHASDNLLFSMQLYIVSFS